MTGIHTDVLQLRILGGIHLTRADGTRVGAVLSQPKRLALLIYLATALPRGSHRKDTLLALFWPEFPQDRARRALNRAVYFLRHCLGHTTLVSRGVEELAVDAEQLWCDAVAFERAFDEDRVEDGLDLYRGDVAPGFHVNGLREFDQWLESERDRLRRVARDAALVLTDRHEARGELAVAAHWAHHALMCAPHDELVIQRHIALLDGAGDRAGAVSAYEAFAARLREDLGVEPSPETRSLYAAVRKRHTATPRGEAAVPAPTAARSVEGEPVSPELSPSVTAPVAPLGSAAARRWIPWAAAGVSVAIGVYALVSMRASAEPVTLGHRSAVAVAAASERWPSLSPDGGTVYYTISSPSGDELFAQPVDGGSPVPITGQIPGSQRFGAVSPDGHLMLVLGDDGLYVMPSLGGQARRVVSGTAGLGTNGSGLLPGSWSPDGAHIVYPQRDTLFTQSLQSGARVAVATGRRIHSPAWSPDGRWIAFVEGNPQFHMNGNIAPSTIRVVPAGGGGTVAVTDASTLHVSPVWVPGRLALLFISDHEGGRDIHEIALNADGSPHGAPVRITTGLDPARLSLSTDGSRLAWSEFIETSTVRALEIPPRDSVPLSRTARITTEQQLIEAVGSVSRDGAWLYYSGTRSGNSDLWRIPVGGGAPEQLTTDSADDGSPAVSPDGRWLAFHSLRTGNRDVFVMPIGGGPAVQVSQGPEQDNQPAWSPDGRALIWRTPSSIRLVRRSDGSAWGTPEVLFEGDSRGGWAQWSPDGRWISFPVPGGLRLHSAVSGPDRLLRSPVGWHVWSDDARTIYGVRLTPSAPMAIVAIPVDGGPSRTVAWADLPLKQLPRYGIAVSGSRLYFPLVERRADVWVGEVVVQ